MDKKKEKQVIKEGKPVIKEEIPMGMISIEDVKNILSNGTIEEKIRLFRRLLPKDIVMEFLWTEADVDDNLKYFLGCDKTKLLFDLDHLLYLDLQIGFKLPNVVTQKIYNILGQDAAEERFREAADNDWDEDAMVKLGIILEGKSNDKSVAYYHYSEATFNDNTHAYFRLGVLAELKGSLDAAMKYYEKAAKGGHLEAIECIGYVLEKQGYALEKKGYKLGRQWAAEMSAGGGYGDLKPGDPLYEIQQGSNKLADKAIELLMLSVNKGKTDAMELAGIILESRGRTDEAETLFRRAAEIGGDLQKFKLGKFLCRRGQTDEGNSLIREACKNEEVRLYYTLIELMGDEDDITLGVPL